MIIDVSLPPPARLGLGRQGENAVTQFQFDISAWVEEYGEGTLTLTAQRNGDAEPYPVSLSGNVWVVSNADTAKEGFGKAQLQYVVDEQVKKSVIYATLVLPSIEASAEPPEPYQTWYDEIVAAKGEAEDAASDAKDYRDEAMEYASDAEGYARQAAEYKVQFADTGDGDIVITRSE